LRFKYKDVLKIQQVERLNTYYPVAIILRWISPLITLFCIKYAIIPNTVTLMMIFFGYIGPIFLLSSTFLIKIIGVICIWLWLTLDLSDGEVARLTKNFSNGGSDLDYIAHLLNHPVMIFSFAYNIYIYFSIPILIVFLCAFLMLIFEMTTRYYYAIDKFVNKHVGEGDDDSSLSKLQRFIKLVSSIFSIFPNFALIFSIMLLMDLKLGLKISIYYAILYLVIVLLKYIKNNISRIIYYYKV